jgi:hypothetical protein
MANQVGGSVKAIESSLASSGEGGPAWDRLIGAAGGELVEDGDGEGRREGEFDRLGKLGVGGLGGHLFVLSRAEIGGMWGRMGVR